MCELLDKQVNVQKESLKKLPGFTQASFPQAHKNVCDENERRKKKRLPHKIFCDEWKDFIRLYQKNG